MPHKISYLLRNLIFGLAFFALFYFGLYPLLLKSSHPQSAPKFLIFIIVNTACYPFAKAVYDEVIGYLMGNSVYVVTWLWTVFVRLFVFWFSFLIAPLYLLFFIPNAINYLKKQRG